MDDGILDVLWLRSGMDDFFGQQQLQIVWFMSAQWINMIVLNSKLQLGINTLYPRVFMESVSIPSEMM